MKEISCKPVKENSYKTFRQSTKKGAEKTVTEQPPLHPPPRSNKIVLWQSPFAANSSRPPGQTGCWHPYPSGFCPTPCMRLAPHVQTWWPQHEHLTGPCRNETKDWLRVGRYQYHIIDMIDKKSFVFVWANFSLWRGYFNKCHDEMHWFEKLVLAKP